MAGEREGRLVVHRVESAVLRGNPHGDPTSRDLTVYLPPGHDGTQPIPALLGLVGFCGTGASLFNVDPLGEDLRRRLDRLINKGRCPRVMVVAPDCFTRVGGNQYINSVGTGRYEDFLVDEVLPEVESRYAVKNWGVFGKSSGGYGSMVLGMRHPDRFKAVADHSGDAGFELCYLPDFAPALDAFRDAGGPALWLDRFWADENRHRRKYHKPLNVVGMAAHYSPKAGGSFNVDLPFDLETGEFRPEVWARWREHDPIHLVEKHIDALKKLRCLYVDCGNRDEFALHWGARALVAKLRAYGARPEYHEFDDGHLSVAYRYDVSLPLLARCLET